MKTSIMAAAVLAAVAGGAAAQDAPPRPPRLRAAPADYPAPRAYPKENAAAVAEHLSAARTIAGPGLFGDFAHRCIISPVFPTRVAGIQHDGRITPTRLFDQFYSIGQNAVSAFALDTADGIVVFDALNSSEEARDLLVPNMVALGLDPKRIRYVVVTHGHGDHYGGARYLQETYGARVLSSAIDWDMMERSRGSGPFKDTPVPKRDMAVTDGQVLTVGATRITFYITPGHTPGTLSMIFPVTDKGVRHVVGFNGGTGGGRDETGLRTSIPSFARWGQLTKAAGVDVLIANHPLHSASLEKEEILRHLKPGDPNPFVIGSDAFQRYVAVQGECAKVQLARMGLPVQE